MKPDIFTYLDYRSFLKDAFRWLKTDTPKLSYRTFAKKTGFSSPNFLQHVIQGKRNLSSNYTVVTCKAFKLNKQETDFFQNLVGYDQAKIFEEKNLFYQKILRNKHYTRIKTLDKSQYEFFTHWYIPVVRELLMHKDYSGHSEWISERVYPRITIAQVEGVKALLQKLSLAHQDAVTGKWSLSNTVISTASEAMHLGMRSYHMSAIQLAQDSLKTFSAQERDIRSVTIGLSEQGYGVLKSKLETVWKEVLDFAGSEVKTERVYQVNMQVFPVTREPTAKESKG